MADYRSLAADELLAALGQADRTVDLDLIRACLERRQELAPAPTRTSRLAQHGSQIFCFDFR